MAPPCARSNPAGVVAAMQLARLLEREIGDSRRRETPPRAAPTDRWSAKRSGDGGAGSQGQPLGELAVDDDRRRLGRPRRQAGLSPDTSRHVCRSAPARDVEQRRRHRGVRPPTTSGRRDRGGRSPPRALPADAAIDAGELRRVRHRHPESPLSVATTRTSYPALSRRSRNDTSRPDDSRSMSNNSAPITATPAIASAARAGSAVIVRHARARAVIGGPATRRRGEAASTTRRGRRRRQGERRRRPPSRQSMRVTRTNSSGVS